jgi:hypothetical protein
MGLLTRTIEGVIDMFTKKESDSVSTTEPTPIPTHEPEEEWIWVEGYKGTDKDMKCLNYQYELGVQYDMPEDEPIQECKNGFHLCLRLVDVWDYYHVGGGNRFFKVKALVRKTDKDNYRGVFRCGDSWYSPSTYNNKLAAKSIIFTSELTYDEILKDTDAQDLPEDYKKIALESSIQNAVNQYTINILVEDGYSLPFATHMVKTGKFDIAHAFGSQKDLSMDMKVLGILYNTQGV